MKLVPSIKELEQEVARRHEAVVGDVEAITQTVLPKVQEDLLHEASNGRYLSLCIDTRAITNSVHEFYKKHTRAWHPGGTGSAVADNILALYKEQGYKVKYEPDKHRGTLGTHSPLYGDWYIYLPESLVQEK